MNTGQIIGEIASKKGINLHQLAKKAKISYNTLYSIVKRKSANVDPDIANKVAIALDVELIDLLDPVIASALENAVDNNIKTADEAIKQRYGITGDYVVVETDEQSINSLLQAYSTLNTEGQNKVIEYATDLAENSKYRRFKLADSAESNGEYKDTGKQKKPSADDTTPTNGI